LAFIGGDWTMRASGKMLEYMDLLWLLGSLSSLYRRPFDAKLIEQDFPPPYSLDTFHEAARALGYKTGGCSTANLDWLKLPLPAIAFLRAAPETGQGQATHEGYQTDIGECGSGLSGGQRQRIAIAWAQLKRPKIVLFDAAVSNLNQQTAEHFARTINKLKGRVTMWFITYQIPRGAQVDEVIELGTKITR